MFAKSFAFLVAAVAAAFVAAPVVAATHHENRNHEHTDPSSIPWSAESKRLGEECRSDPENSEKRRQLRLSLERDFDRYISARRSKLRSGKKHNEARKRLDKVIRERERVINAEIRLLVGDRASGDGVKKPKPPRRKR